MRHHTRTIVAIAAGAILLGACSGDDGATAPDATATDTGTAPDGTAGATEAAADSVKIDDFAYRPPEITVAAGTEVTWTNEDAALHSVTAGTPDAPEPDVFDLDDIDEAGQTVSHTFEEPGTYEYFCRYHDFMLGTVEVTG